MLFFTFTKLSQMMFSSNSYLCNTDDIDVPIPISFSDDLSMINIASRHYWLIQVLEMTQEEAIQLLAMPSIPSRTLLFRMTDPSPGMHPIQPLLKQTSAIIPLAPISGLSLVPFVKSMSVFWLVTSTSGEVQWATFFEEIRGCDADQDIEHQEKEMKKKIRQTRR